MSIEFDNSVRGVMPVGRVEAASLTQILREFRLLVEAQTGVKIERLEVNGAVWLDDIARFIGLRENKRREVLGLTAGQFVDDVNNGRIKAIQ